MEHVCATAIKLNRRSGGRGSTHYLRVPFLGLLTPVLLAGIVTGCNNARVPTSPDFMTDSPGFNEYHGPGGGSLASADTVGPADRSTPEWDGENPAVTSSGPEYICPQALTSVGDLYVNGYNFIVNGEFTKVTDLAPDGAGLPAARYAIPTGGAPWPSTDNQAWLLGGTGDAYCKVWHVFSGDWEIDVGKLQFFNYDVDLVYSDPGGGTGPSSGGWAYKNGTYENGDGDGSWSAALAEFLSTGNCPAGWDIYVDGAPVCVG